MTIGPAFTSSFDVSVVVHGIDGKKRKVDHVFKKSNFQSQYIEHIKLYEQGYPPLHPGQKVQVSFDQRFVRGGYYAHTRARHSTDFDALPNLAASGMFSNDEEGDAELIFDMRKPFLKNTFNLVIPYKETDGNEYVAVDILARPVGGSQQIRAFLVFKYAANTGNVDYFAKLYKVNAQRIYDLTEGPGEIILSLKVPQELHHRLSDPDFAKVEIFPKPLEEEKGKSNRHIKPFNEYNQLIAEEYFECDHYKVDNRKLGLVTKKCYISPEMRYLLTDKLFLKYTEAALHTYTFDDAIIRIFYDIVEYPKNIYTDSIFRMEFGLQQSLVFPSPREIPIKIGGEPPFTDFQCPFEGGNFFILYHTRCVVTDWDPSEVKYYVKEKANSFNVDNIIENHPGELGCFRYVCPNRLVRDKRGNAVHTLTAPVAVTASTPRICNFQYDWGIIRGEIYFERPVSLSRTYHFIIHDDFRSVEAPAKSLTKVTDSYYKFEISIDDEQIIYLMAESKRDRIFAVFIDNSYQYHVTNDFFLTPYLVKSGGTFYSRFPERREREGRMLKYDHPSNFPGKDKAKAKIPTAFDGPSSPMTITPPRENLAEDITISVRKVDGTVQNLLENTRFTRFKNMMDKEIFDLDLGFVAGTEFDITFGDGKSKWYSFARLYKDVDFKKPENSQRFGKDWDVCFYSDKNDDANQFKFMLPFDKFATNTRTIALEVYGHELTDRGKEHRIHFFVYFKLFPFKNNKTAYIKKIKGRDNLFYDLTIPAESSPVIDFYVRFPEELHQKVLTDKDFAKVILKPKSNPFISSSLVLELYSENVINEYFKCSNFMKRNSRTLKVVCILHPNIRLGFANVLIPHLTIRSKIVKATKVEIKVTYNKPDLPIFSFEDSQFEFLTHGQPIIGTLENETPIVKINKQLLYNAQCPFIATKKSVVYFMFYPDCNIVYSDKLRMIPSRGWNHGIPNFSTFTSGETGCFRLICTPEIKNEYGKIIVPMSPHMVFTDKYSSFSNLSYGEKDILVSIENMPKKNFVLKFYIFNSDSTFEVEAKLISSVPKGKSNTNVYSISLDIEKLRHNYETYFEMLRSSYKIHVGAVIHNLSDSTFTYVEPSVLEALKLKSGMNTLWEDLGYESANIFDYDDVISRIRNKNYSVAVNFDSEMFTDDHSQNKSLQFLSTHLSRKRTNKTQQKSRPVDLSETLPKETSKEDVFIEYSTHQYNPAIPNDYHQILQKKKHQKELAKIRADDLVDERENNKIQASKKYQSAPRKRTKAVDLMDNTCGDDTMKSRNVASVDEVDDELEQDTFQKCTKYGLVEQCIVYKTFKNPEVRIFVKFSSFDGAKLARDSLNGKRYNSKMVSARFYPEDSFNYLNLEDPIL
ncbi:hypothetical protein ROZALSC1DRAFT_27040 [Rozella allomycis CSF55]|uniref:RNA recognition motif domain-containing protein n=1 Tax=Rozella allomycis (strain CSF55) TaxID=988480 RepID=A0A075B1J3_ROZAC|nr:hypothetical protein O9G_002971 [Rozella allomycis CSF55]RKP21552.1 hypothetical protein ROZALSC1DRAFT_27040 [Rozella allomycis CSF55]|eukprot:EPZ34653.1 hypothetical protein O9G_002971 [Rozella allomycis CSF55]